MKVKCQDCCFCGQIYVDNELTGTGKCQESGICIIGFRRNGQGIAQPRQCPSFKFSDLYAQREADKLNKLLEVEA